MIRSMNCEHDISDMETAVADGVCPICLQSKIARLREELAETVNQIKLAQKGYDYIGACEDARHYKEVAEQYKAELGAYRLWAEVEIADLRDDVKRLLGATATKLEELK